MRSVRAVAVLALLTALGCQTQPTKVRETPERKYDAVGTLLAPIKITPETIVIDARPQFEFSMAHVPRSVNMQWTDFTQAGQEIKGVLQTDLYAIARRLARAGVEQNSHVVVVGRGPTGEGEEGRVAWTLAYLGVLNTQFATMDSLKFRLTNVLEETLNKSVPIWKPDPIDSLLVTRAELLFAINNLGVHKPISFKSGESPMYYKIIDVRAAESYLGKSGWGARHRVPNMDAINIPWRELFDKNMRPRADVSGRLAAIGVLPEHRIIVVDEDGVSSASATMAFRALGYSKTGNYSAGLIDLLSAHTR